MEVVGTFIRMFLRYWQRDVEAGNQFRRAKRYEV
jgi:hypothetical protein